MSTVASTTTPSTTGSTTCKLEGPKELVDRLLAERRELGQDKHDEVWEGVYHMVPGATGPHQHLALELLLVLAPLAKARGLWCAQDLDLRRPGSGDKDYRQPDLIFCKPYEGDYPTSAEFVIEILSPGDESRRKLGFYADLKVREALLIEPKARTPEMFVVRDAEMKPLKGSARCEVLGVTFERVDGPKLRVTWGSGSADI